MEGKRIRSLVPVLLGLLLIAASAPVSGSALYATAAPRPLPRSPAADPASSASLSAGGTLPSGGLWYNPMPWPFAATWPSADYDTAAGRLIVFGGLGASGAVQDTWAYDPATNAWTHLWPAARPSARFAANLAYDGKADRFVLFGGKVTDSWILNDTWVYDDRNDSWAEMHPASAPQEAWGGGFVYDARADLFLLYGGCFIFNTPACTPMNETWTYDLAADRWTKLPVASSAGPLSEFGMAYSPSWDRTILFGGYPPNCCVLPPPISRTTWSFDYTNRTWTNLNPANPPPPITDEGMAYDSRAGRILLAGGNQAYGGSTYVGTFDYGNDTWQALAPSGGTPSFANQPLVYDPAIDRTLLDASTGALASVGSFDLSLDAWAAGPVPSLMPAEMRPGLAFDSRASRLVFFGGCTGATNGCGNQTWSYDVASGTWVRIAAVVAPSSRTAAAFVYDSRRDRFVLFGGTDENFELGDTWVYDPSNATWTRLHPATAPAPRDDMAAAYDPLADRVLLFGGEKALLNVTQYAYVNDTWSFDLANDTWTNVTMPASPPARYGARMAFDVQLDRAILFGGLGRNGQASGDTWAYDPSTHGWANVTPAFGPSPRTDSDLVYDAAAGRCVLFGGATNFPPYVVDGDTWAYDAANGTWIAANPGPSPASRGFPSLAYVANASAIAMVGGTGVNGAFQDFWFYRYGPSIPTPPQSLRALGGSSLVRLTWSPPGSNGDSAITGYRVYRNVTGGAEIGPWVAIATVGNVLTYDDSAVVARLWYYYTVSAINGVGESNSPGSVFASAGPVVSVAAVTGQAGKTVNITATIEDYATGNWSLDFGDGSPLARGTYRYYASSENASHIYALAGTYTLRMNASHGFGWTIASAVATILPGPATYSVSFTETGLPAGTNWSVTLNGSTRTSTTDSITFAESNGTYSFVVGAIPGYAAAPSSGSAVVGGHPVPESVVFAATTPPFSYGVAIGAAVVIVAVVAVVLFLWQRRKRSVPPTGPPREKDAP